MKKCPYCFEEIQEAARKCRFGDTWLASSGAPEAIPERTASATGSPAHEDSARTPPYEARHRVEPGDRRRLVRGRSIALVSLPLVAAIGIAAMALAPFGPDDATSENRAPKAGTIATPTTNACLISEYEGTTVDPCPTEASSRETYVGLWSHQAVRGEDRLSIYADGSVILSTGGDVSPGRALLDGNRLSISVAGFWGLEVRAIAQDGLIALLLTSGSCSESEEPLRCGQVFQRVDTDAYTDSGDQDAGPAAAEGVVDLHPQEAFVISAYVGTWLEEGPSGPTQLVLYADGRFEYRVSTGAVGTGVWRMNVDTGSISSPSGLQASLVLLEDGDLALLVTGSDCASFDPDCGRIFRRQEG